MIEVQFESEAFLKLLTDALRSGPGSPEWRDATRRLRDGGVAQADEYQMLVTAREHLESGKEYRSISAGPEFTRRLMDELERESIETKSGPPTTNLVALACAAAMLAVLLAIGWLLYHATDDAGPQLLTNTVATLDLSGKPNPQWRKIGAVQLETARGGARYIESAGASGQGGGFVWDKPIPPGEAFSVQVSVRVPKPEENLVAQVFITDSPTFSDENSLTPHEMVWLIQSKEAQLILPNGRMQAQSEEAVLRGGVGLRITIDGPEATVEMNRQPWWKGEHLLDPDKPRYVGIRYLRRDPKAEGGIYFSGIRINMRQQ